MKQTTTAMMMEMRMCKMYMLFAMPNTELFSINA